MTIEQKIKILIDNEYPLFKLESTFQMENIVAYCEKINAISMYTLGWRGEPEKHNDLCEKINTLIKEADEVECLTSKFEYIRECKKWFMERR